MNKKSLIFIGLLGLIIIFFLCGLKHYRKIEHDIANCSNIILNNANLTDLNVITHNLGQDAIITGVVKKKTQKKNALSLLKNKCHLTSLSDEIIYAPVTPTIEPNLSIKINSSLNIASMTGRTIDSEEVEKIITTFNQNMHNIKLDTNIIYDDEIFPSSFAQYLSIILPKLKYVNNPEVLIANKQLTLKGLVTNHAIKNNIGKVLRLRFRNRLKVNNLLSINSFESNQLDNMKKPLSKVKLCQLKLSAILSRSMIHFNSSSATIKPESHSLLDKLANAVNSCHEVKITVIGHTDKSGNELFNLKLSKKRALSVINYLEKIGVKNMKLKAKGVGSSQPIATNETVIGRSKNRRIEFKVNSL